MLAKVLVFLVIIFLIIAFLILFRYRNTWKISKQDKKKFFLDKEKILNNKVSNKEKLIDLDKLYHLILKKIWYSWTFWEILKLKPREIVDINKVWELHKLRNKLVHDFDLISESSLKKKVLEYSHQIDKLLK